MATAKMPSAKRATAMMATAMMVELQLAFQGNCNQSDSDETKLSFIDSFPVYLRGQMIERTNCKDPAASMAPDQAEMNQALLDLHQACYMFTFSPSKAIKLYTVQSTSLGPVSLLVAHLIL